MTHEEELFENMCCLTVVHFGTAVFVAKYDICYADDDFCQKKDDKENGFYTFKEMKYP